jgi:hypothetical protein
MSESDWGLSYAHQAERAAQEIPDGPDRERAYAEAFAKQARAALERRGIAIVETPTAKEREDHFRKTLGPLLQNELANKNIDEQHDRLRELQIAGYPPVKAAQDVAIVIGRFKNVDPATIAAADPLTKFRFQADEKRSMAILLDDFYLSNHYVMDKQLQPWETQPAVYVSDFIARVVEHNPHHA